MQFYRRRPELVIQVMRYATDRDNRVEIVTWIKANGGNAVTVSGPHGCRIAVGNSRDAEYAYPGDYIMRGTSGVFFPCSPEVFEADYEPACPIHAGVA